MDTLGKRIAHYRKQAGLSQQALAELCGDGWGQSRIGNYEKDARQPRIEEVATIAAALGVAPVALLGYPQQEEALNVAVPLGASVISYRNLDELDPEDYVFIDRYDVKLSAGNGNAAWVVREKDPLSFRAAWFKKKGLHPEACKALYVRGRSMEPKLEDWDTVLIDTLDTDLIDGEVYAVTYRDQFYIKTLERTGDGVLLKSENPEYKSISVPADDLGRLKIMGRKVWRGG